MFNSRLKPNLENGYLILLTLCSSLFGVVGEVNSNLEDCDDLLVDDVEAYTFSTETAQPSPSEPPCTTNESKESVCGEATPPPSEPKCTTTSTYYRCELTSIWTAFHGFVGVKTETKCEGKEPVITTNVSDYSTANDQSAFRNFINGGKPAAASCTEEIVVSDEKAAACVRNAWFAYSKKISTAVEIWLTILPVTGRRCHGHRENYLRIVESCKVNFLK